jgi:sugar transferase EpsL
MGNPVFFSQKRIGLMNKEFKIYKFRSMVERSESKQTDEQRIPPLGHLIRKLRIDELPQIWNILIGDMSFIGPRPLLIEYLPYYTDAELRRHEVRPGLSGLSQVSSLSNPIWEEQFKLDITYVENISFRMDILILLKTIKKIFSPAEMMTTRIGGRVNFVRYRTAQREKLSKDFFANKGNEFSSKQ